MKSQFVFIISNGFLETEIEIVEQEPLKELLRLIRIKANVFSEKISKKMKKSFTNLELVLIDYPFFPFFLDHV